MRQRCHRPPGQLLGFSGKYNSSFQKCDQLGVDWAELDIHRPKDGKLVVIHDKNTGKVGDKGLMVANATYEELLSVDVAKEFTTTKGRTVEQVPAQHISLLEEVIGVFLKQNYHKMSIQPKTDCVEEAIQLNQEWP